MLFKGFLLHLLGDYLFQNDYLANNKTKSFTPAFIHALIYSLPFLALVNGAAWWIVLISHYFIDRYRLAVHYIRLVNIRFTIEYCTVLDKNGFLVLKTRYHLERNDTSNFGYDPQKPAFIAFWLMIIVDNSIHILINSLCIEYQSLINGFVNHTILFKPN